MLTIDNLKIHPAPDFSRLEKVLTRQGVPDRVPFFEPFSHLMAEICGDRIRKVDCHDEEEYQWRVGTEYWYRLGYDYVADGPANLGFPETDRNHGASLMDNDDDFVSYAWPSIDAVDFDKVGRLSKFLYPGMKLVPGLRGVFETVATMMSYENLCLCILEQPAFFQQVCDRIGGLVNAYVDICAGMDEIGAIVLFEDLGFKTQTMVSPEMLRTYIFPWYHKFAQSAHRHGTPLIIHACGNLREVYEDIIGSGFDAKQSFEDTIEPIWDFKKRYGGRISALGGFDMDKLVRMNEAEVRQHARFLVDACAPGGGYAMGTGNAVANFIPVENYLAMLEETFLYSRY